MELTYSISKSAYKYRKSDRFLSDTHFVKRKFGQTKY